MTEQRENIPLEDTWNVEELYPNLKIWQEEIQAFVEKGEKGWDELGDMRGKLHLGPRNVQQTLDLYFSYERKLSALFTWAHLKHDEQITHEKHKIAFRNAQSLLFSLSESSAWIEPELLSLPEAQYQELLCDPTLHLYHFYLEKLYRMRPHTLSPKEEELIAMSGQPMQTAERTFSALHNADLLFGSVLDKEGNPHEISHASYSLHLRSHDRTLRENVFKEYHTQYTRHENTLAELLQGVVHTHTFRAKAKGYANALNASLYPNNIDPHVYTNLIETVNAHLSIHHRYLALRKKIMGVESLHLWDVYVPLAAEFEMEVPYPLAVEWVTESVAPLGKHYQDIAIQGLTQDRWVDKYENVHKRSGGYSSGCYDSFPYILLNYKEQLRDVFTLAHELGHSMHSYFSRANQPYIYADYSIFLAEIASTFNEFLLAKRLIERASTKTEKMYLINQQIENIRATLFRQTMFAEFELAIHNRAEGSTPLTPETLKSLYLELNEKYFGSSVCIDPEIAIEWARIPHFYYNFYVYQYATGISAALILFKQVTSGKGAHKEAYLTFLKGGSSQYPLDLLKDTGVDLLSPAPIESALSQFESLVGQLETLALT